MPSKPKKLCAKVNCPNLTKSRFCEEHESERKEEHKRYKKNRTDVDEQRFYSSSQWRKVRKKQLSREPLCRMCKSEGRLTGAQMVDHINPIKDGGDRLGKDNLQSLCFSCHNRKTADERG